MTTATLDRIVKVSDKPWGDNGLIFIDLTFTDHAPATLSTNEQGKNARLADLEARIGKPEEWEFGVSKSNKPTVKIPKPEGSFGGGGKKGWQPKSIEERAEIMSMNLMTAAVNLYAVPTTSMTFEDAIKRVKEGMGDLLTYTREALKVSEATPSSDNVGAETGKPRDRAVGSPPRPVESGAEARVSEGPQTVSAPTPRSDGEAKEPSTAYGEGAGTAPASSSDSIQPHRFRAEEPDDPCIVCGYAMEAEHHVR